MTQNLEDNNKLITDLEAELLELTQNMNNNGNDERNVHVVIDELLPLCRANEKVNLLLYDQVQKYVEYGHECIQKSFESIRDFYQNLICNHQNFTANLAKREEAETAEINKLKTESEVEIDKLESEINDSKQKISLLVSDDEINAEASHCKQVLSQIEKENRIFFQKVSNVFDDQPSKVIQIFEESEKVVLDLLKLKKVDSPKPSITAKKPPRQRSQSAKKSVKIKSPISEAFKIECGIEFESIEPLTVIPTFDDFLDAYQPPNEKSSYSKSDKGRRSSYGKRNLPKFPSKSGKNNSKSGNQNQKCKTSN